MIGPAVRIGQIARGRGESKCRVIELGGVQRVAEVVEASGNQHLAIHGARCILGNRYAEISVRVNIVSIKSIGNGNEQIGCPHWHCHSLTEKYEILRDIGRQVSDRGWTRAARKGRREVRSYCARNSIERSSRGKQRV